MGHFELTARYHEHTRRFWEYRSNKQTNCLNDQKNQVHGNLLKEVLGDGNKVNGLRYQDRTNNAEHTIELEGIFVQIGLLPNTEWLKGTIDLSPRGEIIVDPKGETSLPGVFAAGDCTTIPYKQIIIAAGEGAKAALSAFDYLIRQ